MSRFYQTSESQFGDYSYELPFNEMLGALAAKQQHLDVSRAQLDVLGEVSNVRAQDLEGLRMWKNYLDDNISKLSEVDLTSREGKQEFQKFARSVRDASGPDGAVGRMYSNYAQQQQALEDISQNKDLAQNRKQSYQQIITSQPGVMDWGQEDISWAGGEYRGLSVPDFAHEVNYGERLKNYAAMTNASAWSKFGIDMKNSPQGMIFTHKNSDEYITYDKAVEVLYSMSMSDEGLINFYTEGRELGFSDPEQSPLIRVPVLDGNGNPVVDEDGNEVTKIVANTDDPLGAAIHGMATAISYNKEETKTDVKGVPGYNKTNVNNPGTRITVTREDDKITVSNSIVEAEQNRVFHADKVKNKITELSKMDLQGGLPQELEKLLNTKGFFELADVDTALDYISNLNDEDYEFLSGLQETLLSYKMSTLKKEALQEPLTDPDDYQKVMSTNAYTGWGGLGILSVLSNNNYDSENVTHIKKLDKNLYKGFGNMPAIFEKVPFYPGDNVHDWYLKAKDSKNDSAKNLALTLRSHFNRSIIPGYDSASESEREEMFKNWLANTDTHIFLNSNKSVQDYFDDTLSALLDNVIQKNIVLNTRKKVPSTDIQVAATISNWVGGSNGDPQITEQLNQAFKSGTFNDVPIYEVDNDVSLDKNQRPLWMPNQKTNMRFDTHGDFNGELWAYVDLVNESGDEKEFKTFKMKQSQIGIDNVALSSLTKSAPEYEVDNFIKKMYTNGLYEYTFIDGHTLQLEHPKDGIATVDDAKYKIINPDGKAVSTSEAKKILKYLSDNKLLR